MTSRCAQRDEEAHQRFRELYGRAMTDLSIAIEQRVIGGAWGANGYTTKRQADELLCRLDLGVEDVLLDVGTGRGWPGVYLATRSGCRLVGTDLPLDALRVASERSRIEKADGRVALAAASGARQPFRSGVFDAVVHTDVIC